MDRCEEIKKQIRDLQNELKSLEAPKCIDYSQYDLFRNGMYGYPSLKHCLRDDLRHLAVHLASLKEAVRGDGSKYLEHVTCYKISSMNKDQIKFCNDFVNEIYPIIEKYAERKLLESKEAK